MGKEANRSARIITNEPNSPTNFRFMDLQNYQMFELIHLRNVCYFPIQHKLYYLVVERKIKNYKLQNSSFLDVAQHIQHWPEFSDQLLLLPRATGLETRILAYNNGITLTITQLSRY
jgi:hypothetical protein